jgi:hypothetical protein
MLQQRIAKPIKSCTRGRIKVCLGPFILLIESAVRKIHRPQFRIAGNPKGMLLAPITATQNQSQFVAPFQRMVRIENASDFECLTG